MEKRKRQKIIVMTEGPEDSTQIVKEIKCKRNMKPV